MDLLLPPAWAVEPARTIVAAQQGGDGTPGWLIALIGVAGVVIGGLLTLWGNQLSASREAKRRNEDRCWEERKRSQHRLWEEKRKLYETVTLWIGQTEKELRDLYYSYTQYISSPASTGGNAPRPLLRKQREYRQIVPLDQWVIPGGLGEDILTLLSTYAPQEIAQMAEQVQDSAVRTADEALSLGRNAINLPNRSSADRARPTES